LEKDNGLAKIARLHRCCARDAACFVWGRWIQLVSTPMPPVRRLSPTLDHLLKLTTLFGVSGLTTI
ncbi:MAG: hypothetical protein ACXWNB_08190, partial [Candidatus Binataceae bacterium]